MRSLLITILLFGLLGCNENRNDEVATPEELLLKYYSAIGGHDNLKAIQTKIMDGHYIEPGYNLLLKAHMEYKRPYYRIIGDTLSGFAEGYDGESWEYSKNKGYYRTTGEAAKATERGAEFDDSFVDFEEKGYKLEFNGRSQVEEQEYYELVLYYKDGDVKRYFFDTHTYLPRYMTKTMPLHAVGEPIDYLVGISDYRKVGRILFPFSKIERNVKTGKMVNATILDTIILNHEIPLSLFSPHGIEQSQHQ